MSNHRGKCRILAKVRETQFYTFFSIFFKLKQLELACENSRLTSGGFQTPRAERLESRPM